ncbi:hypothetical protein ABNG14_47330 (plasmid) [Streptomyces rapamycinicus]
MSTGQPHWVRRLAAQAAALTDDPELSAEASLRVGQVLTLSTEHDTAMSLLLRAAEDPKLRRAALSSASVAGFYSGDEEYRRTVRARAHDDPWTLTVTDPTAHRSERVAAIPALVERADGDPARLISLGAMAWLLDETALAVRIFDDALHRWRLGGSLPIGLGCSAGWSYLDHGRWAQARTAAVNTNSAGAGLPHLDAAARSLEAAALALTGRTDEARTAGSAALSLVDPHRSRASPSGPGGRWAWPRWPTATTSARTSSSACCSPPTVTPSTTRAPTRGSPNWPPQPSAPATAPRPPPSWSAPPTGSPRTPRPGCAS